MLHPNKGLLLMLCIALHSQGILAEHRVHSKPAISVGILLFDGVQIIDFSAPYEVFGQAGFGVYTVSADGSKVTTAMGLSVTPDYAFESMPEADVILVPGGNIHAAAADKQTRKWLQQQAEVSDYVVSVCTGSHILAGSGLLDGLTATTFHSALDDLQEDNPKITVVDDVRFVDNGKIITSAGLSSGIDAALHVVSRAHGLERAKTVAMHLEYDWQPEGGFVRAAMADRYLPAFDVEWPKHTRFRRLHHYGDSRQWTSRHQGATGFSQQELKDFLIDGMNKEAGWTTLPQSNDQLLRWEKAEGDQQVVMSLDVGVQQDQATILIELLATPGNSIAAIER